jgi:hypothetical protein
MLLECIDSVLLKQSYTIGLWTFSHDEDWFHLHRHVLFQNNRNWGSVNQQVPQNTITQVMSMLLQFHVDYDLYLVDNMPMVHLNTEHHTGKLIRKSVMPTN